MIDSRSPARRLALAPALLLGLMSAAAAFQGMHDDRIEVELQLKGEQATRIGRLRIKKGKAHFTESGRRRTIKLEDIVSLTELDPERPPTEGELAAARADYEKKLEYHKPEDPSRQTRLAIWCREHGLEELAKKHLEAAVKLAPDHRDARRLRAEVKVKGQWRPVAEVSRERWDGLDGAGFSALVKFGDWASTWRLPEGRKALDKTLKINIRDQDSLRAMKRYTDHYRLETRCRPPFAGLWRASIDKSKHHRKKAYAVYALDLLKVGRDLKRHDGKGKKLEDWFSWDEPVFAVADGIVVEVRNQLPDLPINRGGGRPEKHNGVSIRHKNAEHSFYVHLRKGSIPVKVGEKVKRGQLIGRVGNSGGTNVPHLHFAMAIPSALSVPMWWEDYKLYFEGVEVPVKLGKPREGQVFVGPAGLE